MRQPASTPGRTLHHRAMGFSPGALAALFFLESAATLSQTLTGGSLIGPGKQTLVLSNDRVECTIVLESGAIIEDWLASRPRWTGQETPRSCIVKTDADFEMEIMWTDWQAPKKINNAENPIQLSKVDFLVERQEQGDREGGRKEVTLYLRGKATPLLARLTYQLDSSAFYLRRKLSVIDTTEAGHFLQRISPRKGHVAGPLSIVKEGGFGQPVAFRIGKGGGFFGLEYPAAENVMRSSKDRPVLDCSQEIGEKIGKSGIESAWCVEGLAPNEYVKLWFSHYVDDMRIAPLKPYTLYNSWYDLRSVEYPKVPEANWMNEKNIMRIVDLLRRNMIDKHNIRLDAFVLDDGWDVYESDWTLREKQFPRGLAPIADELKKTNTALGMWLGPTGGYSFRMKRIDWMKERGYEVVGHTKNTAMMCLAGRRYSALFEKRVTDLVEKEGVGYFKWDGIQFSCSEVGHDHPVGIYSRRAVMESVIEKCAAVRRKNPNVFLNVTSGTWLSPWWVRYVNQIWMQGEDYGYADVPSISPRDAAITYRDFVLYDDFTNQQQWFPIANMMTHGIIKGALQMLGGRDEPLDKFTNEVLLYLARGVSMWELYISPDILTDGEWNALSQALQWARDRFPILTHTEMIGGDPMKRQAYGYVHFREKKGIIAARNPWIEKTSLRVVLDPSLGLDADASSLVVDRVYPNRWISPRLYHTGQTVDIPLNGYETALYEIYPLAEANTPLLAGVTFDVLGSEQDSCLLSVYDAGSDARLLNAGRIRELRSRGSLATLGEILARVRKQQHPPETRLVSFSSNPASIRAAFVIDTSVVEASVAVLLTPDRASHGVKPPDVIVTIDGRQDTARHERSAGQSLWYTVAVRSGTHACEIRGGAREQEEPWRGRASVWLVYQQRREGVEVRVTVAGRMLSPPMPPRAFPTGVRSVHVKVGESTLVVAGR